MDRKQIEASSEVKIKALDHLFRSIFDACESFEEQHLGADLSYLMGAILKGTICVWGEERALVQLLKADPSLAWALAYVKIEKI